MRGKRDALFIETRGKAQELLTQPPALLWIPFNSPAALWEVGLLTQTGLACGSGEKMWAQRGT